MALGIHNGPEIGQWKQAACEAQLNGQFADQDAGLEWLRRQLRNPVSLPYLKN